MRSGHPVIGSTGQRVNELFSQLTIHQLTNPFFLVIDQTISHYQILEKLGYLLFDPTLEDIRTAPRFVALMKKVGLVK